MKMAVPTVISQLINLIYSIVDTFFIGQTGDAYKTAAVTLAFTIFMMTIAFSNLFGIGGGSHIARLIGRGEDRHAKSVSSFSFYCAIATALLYSLLIFSFEDSILNLFGASEKTIEYAKQYVLLVVIIGNLPNILSMTVSHLLRNAGYSKQAGFGLSAGGIINMILDPILMFVVFPSGMEVFGAALATLIAYSISCIYLVIMLKRVSASSPLSMDIRLIRSIRRFDIKEVFAVGVPSAVLPGLFDVANIFLNKLSSAHGDLELAAMGIVMKAERLPNAINIGLCQGMLPIVAYNFSSGNRERMKETIKKVREYGMIISVFSIILFEISASPVCRLFLSTSSDDAGSAEAVIALATVFLRFRCLASLSQFMNYHSSYCLQAIGAGRDTLIHAVVRELVFYIPFMFALDALFGANGLASALLAGETVGALFALMLLRRQLKKQPSLKAA